MAFELNTPIFDMTSEEYHSTTGTWSSSQVKDAKKPELFYAKYIAKTIAREESTNFDIGTYVHTGTLEPDKLGEDCIVFPGKIRRGKEWDEFKVEHAGKAIISQSEVSQANSLIKAVQDSPVAMSYIKRGQPEISMFVMVLVHAGEIYCPSRNLIHTRNGWLKADKQELFEAKRSKKSVPLILKVRADSLGPDFVLDVKTTSADCHDEWAVKAAISHYSYDLSAAMYLDIFEAGLGRPMRKFIWSFASKKTLSSKSWRASEKNILVGRAKFRKGIFAIANGIATNWEFGDTLGILEPSGFELDHLIETDADLL